MKKLRDAHNGAERIQTGFRLSRSVLDEIADLVECCQAEAPPYLKITDRLIVEAAVHHAKKLKDEGKLSYSTFFGSRTGTAT